MFIAVNTRLQGHVGFKVQEVGQLFKLICKILSVHNLTSKQQKMRKRVIFTKIAGSIISAIVC